MKDLIIAGGGPAGLTAAIYAGRAERNPLLLTGPLPGGLITRTSDVENYPGFPEAVNGFELAEKMRCQAEKFQTEFSEEVISSVELGSVQKLHLESGRVLECRALIIATGAVPRPLGIPSEETFRNRGVSYCATCDGAFYAGEDIVVAGGGDSAMEEALFLANIARSVTVIHRRDKLRASPIMARRALEHEKIRFLWNSKITEIFGKDEVEGVKISDVVTGETSSVSCKGVFIALGHVPETQLFRGQIALDAGGFIQLSGASSRTSVPGVFAAGDCADPHYRQVVTACGMGARAAMDAVRYLESLQG